MKSVISDVERKAIKLQCKQSRAARPSHSFGAAVLGVPVVHLDLACLTKDNNKSQTAV